MSLRNVPRPESMSLRRTDIAAAKAAKPDSMSLRNVPRPESMSFRSDAKPDSISWRSKAMSDFDSWRTRASSDRSSRRSASRSDLVASWVSMSRSRTSTTARALSTGTFIPINASYKVCRDIMKHHGRYTTGGRKPAVSPWYRRRWRRPSGLYVVFVSNWRNIGPPTGRPCRPMPPWPPWQSCETLRESSISLHAVASIAGCSGSYCSSQKSRRIRGM